MCFLWCVSVPWLHKRHILHQHWYTYPTALPVRRNPQHRSLLTVVSANPTPPFQTPCHQRNVCHPVVNRFMRQTLPNKNRKTFLYEYPLHWVLLPTKKTYNIMLLFGNTLLKHGRHFDYRIQSLNMCIHVCYLDCHEAGLCCYLVIHIENLLHPLQLFYFHFWPIYWLSLVCMGEWRYSSVLCYPRHKI
jgi:hypothetical protein